MRITTNLAALILLGLGACQSVQTTAPGAIGVDRKQLMLVSEAEVESGAVTAYAAEVGKARESGVLNANPREVQRVRGIAQRLIKQTPVFRPDALQWNWDINVQSTAELNAYCMPGGKIMVYTGLIDTLQLTDAELAAVVGHEMAHALREHSREAVSRSYAEKIGLEGLALVTGMGDLSTALADQVAQVTFILPRSRIQESEADRIGIELMARAGYDPHSALSLWEKMGKMAQGGSPAFLNTHPSSASRLSDLQALLPRVLPLYQAAPKS
jgi:predicted Zn-dependent protease